MKYRKNTASVLLALTVIFFVGINATQKDDAEERVTKKYFHDLKVFREQMMLLQQNLVKGQTSDSLQKNFLLARLSYKKAEPIIEYYFPHYIYLLNPPAIKMAEDLNPPQGMQVIEERLFPSFDPEDKEKLLGDLYKINSAIQALSGFDEMFRVDTNLPDALIEELYRIITQGITGFDSPIAQHSITEASSSLGSVREMLEINASRFISGNPSRYQHIIELLKQSEQYCRDHAEFNSFDRMHFIRTYMNPVTDWLGSEKIRLGVYDFTRTSKLPLRPGIYKYYSLFDQRLLSPVFFAADSSVSSPALIALGKKLFFDPVLSGNNQRSCATCHNPSLGFTDGLPRSLALQEHKTVLRNAPTLLNSGLQRDLFYDHRQSLLEDLVREVLANKEEMNSSADEVAVKLADKPGYAAVYRDAFGEQPYTGKHVSRAIAAYVRSLTSLNSRFDLHMRGHQKLLNEEEIQGFNLFMGKAKCGTCHFAPLFNGSKPPLYSIIESEVIGVPNSKDTIHPVLDADRGRIAVSNAEVHAFSFKTPTVRNIAITGPYMHNGVYTTLEEVVDFYNKGGGAGLGIDLPNQTLPFDKLNLTDPEKKALVSFMKSLTDTSFLKTAY